MQTKTKLKGIFVYENRQSIPNAVYTLNEIFLSLIIMPNRPNLFLSLCPLFSDVQIENARVSESKNEGKAFDTTTNTTTKGKRQNSNGNGNH
jgi:hypothetical protein